MSYSDFTNHKAETQAIIDKHKNDFTSKDVYSYIQKAGGYAAYVRSLGGVFTKYIDFKGKVSTYEELSEIGDYVWGLYDIWGVDYSNGCSYTYSNNIYKAKAGKESRFYLTEDPKARFNVNYAAFSFANGNDLPGVDEMLGNPNKYYAVVNCGLGVVQMLKKAGLCPKSFPDPAEYPKYWKDHGYPYKLIKNSSELQVGDVLYLFKTKIPNRDTITELPNWTSGGYHTTIVGERTADGYVLYDSGHAYTYYGEFRNIRKFGDKPYQWATDWIALRFNFGLVHKNMNQIEKAREVWNGTYGSGETRQKALGADYKYVQHFVELGKNKLDEILNAKTDAEKLVKLAQTQLGIDGTLPNARFGYRDEWCSEFVAFCANALGLIDKGLMPNADTCPKAHAFYKPKNQLFSKDRYKPKPGDIAYFGDNGEQHTAIVESFDGKTLVTLDGKQGTQGYLKSIAGRCKRNINDSWVWGFANPLNPNKSIIRLAIEVLEGKYGSGDTRKKNLGNDYTEVQTLVDKELKQMSIQDAIIDLLAQEVLTGYWGSGDARKNNLKNAEYDYSKVQARVNILVEEQKPKNGWIKDNNKWYYYKDNKKLTGLNYLDYNGQSNWYYFDKDGIMQTGEVVLTATFDSSGRLIK